MPKLAWVELVFLAVVSVGGQTAEPPARLQFDPRALEHVPKIQMAPEVAWRTAAGPEGPLVLRRTGPQGANWPYETPRGMALCVDGALWLLNATGSELLCGRLDGDGVLAFPPPRLTAGDDVSELTIQQSAVYSPRTGVTPPMPILLRIAPGAQAGPVSSAMVARYVYHPDWDPSLQWQHFLRPEAVADDPDLGGPHPDTWGLGLSLDADGNAYVAFADEEARLWRAALFDPAGRFVRVVPSHLRDAEGYYYARRPNGLAVHDPDGRARLEVVFPERPGPGNLVAFEWQAAEKGVWVSIATGGPGRNRAYVQIGPDGKPLQWLEFEAQRVLAGLHAAMLRPFFCLDGNLYYGAIEIERGDGTETPAYIVFRCPVSTAPSATPGLPQGGAERREG